jgi:seryl-tRNA synthetase
MPRSVLEQSGYLSSFPDMIGSVSVFRGDNAEHKRLMEVAQSGGEWTSFLEAADVSLCPAVCHPLYPTLRGTLPEGGRRYDVSGWCFRREPSVDPARMQSFRQHDLVYVGEAEEARQHRDRWLQLGSEILDSLGLVVETVVANDPFFGRVGRILAENQRSETLKYEIVTPINSAEQPTAIASANCHLDHFGEPFGIVTAEGEVAHSCCFGFGLDRITLGLLRTHGMSPAEWPASARDRLWP